MKQIKIVNKLTARKGEEITFNNVKDISTYIKKHEHCYEIVGSEVTKYIKPYFDIDIKKGEEGFDNIFNDKEKFLNNLCDIITTKFKVNNKDLAISQTTREDKVSYHIVIHSYKVKYDKFKKFMDYHKKDFQKVHIDYAVYGKYKKFRLIKCSKEINNLKKRPVNYKKNLSYHLITYMKKQPILKLKVPKTIEEPKKITKPKDNPTVKNIVVKDECTYKRLENICTNLDPTRFDAYDSWRNIALSICNVAQENKYESKGKALLNRLSQESPEYDYDKFTDFINNSYKYTEGYGLGFLLNMLKEDNHELFLMNTLGYNKSYKKVKEDFEKIYFKLQHPLMFCRIHDDDILTYTKSDFTNLHENSYYYKIIKKKDKEILCKKNIVSTWLKDETIRTYFRMDFYPDVSKCPDNVYNLFTGFDIDKEQNTYEYDESKIKIILDHIRILAGSDDTNYEYFIKWIAQIFQKAGELSRTAIVLYSKQGVGKGLLNQFLANIIGDKYVYSTANANDILGKNAEGLKNRLLVNLDEASGKDTFMQSNLIKSLITEPKISYHKKYFQPMQINNFSRFIFTTNNDTAVKIEASDRRFVVFECDSKYKCNQEYFKPLIKAIRSKEVQYIFYKYIMKLDINGFDFETNRPKTDIYKDMQKVNLPKAILFLINLIEENKIKEEYRANSLFKDYQEFLYTAGYNDYKTNATKFGRALKKIKKGIKKKKSNTVKILINKEELISYLEEEYSYTSDDYLF